MRQLTLLNADPFWAICCREAVTTSLAGLWLVYRRSLGLPTLPPRPTLIRILLIAVLVEVVANVCQQWSLGVLGLAVLVPTVFGSMIISGAVLGRVWLGERVSLRTTFAIVVLIGSLSLLSLGAQGVASPGSEAVRPATILLAIGLICFAGVVFATMTAVIRHSVTGPALPAAVAFLVPLMGVVGLGPICIARLGAVGLWNTPPDQLLFMAVAGVCNLIGFVALIHGLQRTTVVHANVLNASQVAMAAIAGVFLFQESPNPSLVIGVVLSIAGILGVDRPVEARDEIVPP